jgi:hypothetical protein
VVEESKSESESTLSVADELKELGRQLSAAIKSAWESDERKELEREISEGLKALGDQIDEAVETARDSEAVKGMKADVKRAVETVREGDAIQTLREGLAGGLRTLNREIGDLSSSLESEEKPEPGEQPPEAAAQGDAGEPGAAE